MKYKKRDELVNDIKRHEGFMLKPYVCPMGKLSIGYGRNLDDNGISLQEAELMLKNDINNAIKACRDNINFFDDLPIPAQEVLINMCFQMGIGSLLKFKKTLAYLKNKQWSDASVEMLDSAWHKQTPSRARELSSRIKRLGGENV